MCIVDRQKGSVEVSPVTSKRELMEFIRFPWKVYRGDKHWVPPLIKDQQRLLSPSNPFFDHGEADYYLARRGNTICGRVSVSIDHNYVAFHGTKMGSFGFFEVFNDFQVASRLLDTARDVLKQKGMEQISGPLNFTARQQRGLLIHGYDSDPMVGSAYNPPYYVELLEQYGLAKAADYYSYNITDLEVDLSFVRKLAEKASHNRVVARNVPPREIPREMERFTEAFTELYNNAWTKNWGYSPMTKAEAEQIATDIRFLATDGLVHVGEVAGRLVGFLIVLPDYSALMKKMNGKLGPVQMLQFLGYKNCAEKRRAQGFVMGVHKDYQGTGVAAAMAVKAYDSVIRLGYKSAELSAALEDNVASRTIVEMLGGKRHKTHRVYQMPLSSP